MLGVLLQGNTKVRWELSHHVLYVEGKMSEPDGGSWNLYPRYRGEAIR